jgi:hypothetical protein
MYLTIILEKRLPTPRVFAGLDLVLDKLRVAGADFSSVKAISGPLFFH